VTRSKFNVQYPIVGSREWFQPYYGRWMWEVDSLRANTSVVPWRSVVANEPGLLYNGDRGQNISA
jgi:hypothetical protein